MDFKAVISYYESKSTSLTRVSTQINDKQSGMQFKLKRRPAFHDKKWQKSVREWQEKASKNRKMALTDRYVNHILG